MTFSNTCSFGLPERSTDNSCVHRIHTPSVHHEQYSLLTSTDHTCALWLKSLAAQDCSIIIVRMKTVQSSGPPYHLYAVSSTSSHFKSITTRSTTWTASPSPRHSVHRALLPEPTQSTNSANEPLSHVIYKRQKPAEHLYQRL